MPRAIIDILLRNWQAVIGAVAVLALVILLSIRTSQRNEARAERDQARAQVASLEGHIAAQNAGIEQMRVERAAAQERASAALLEAQRVNARQQPTIERLRESAGRPVAPGAPCTVSDALRNVEGL